MLSTIFEIFRTFPMILMIVSFMDSILFKSIYSFWLLMGLILNGLIWEISTKYISFNWPSLEDRPNRYHCAYYESNEPITSGGLPSGHCQSMAFFVIWVILIIWNEQEKINIVIIISIIARMQKINEYNEGTNPYTPDKIAKEEIKARAAKIKEFESLISQL